MIIRINQMISRRTGIKVQKHNNENDKDNDKNDENDKKDSETGNKGM